MDLVRKSNLTNELVKIVNIFSEKYWEECPEASEKLFALVESIKNFEDKEPECTLEPYCKCENCRDYAGDLPIDRI